MKGNILRKLRKCNVSDLLSWVSLCQLAEVNKDKAAFIEYAIGVISTLDFSRDDKKRKVNATLIDQVFKNVLLDFDSIRAEASSSLQFNFTLAHLTIRGDGYPWQYAETSVIRYKPHNKWMLDNFGFTIQDAVDISKRILNQISKKQLNSYLNISAPFTKEKYYNPKYIYIPDKSFVNTWKKCITFTENELEKIDPFIKTHTISNFLNRMSTDISSQRTILESPVDFNILYERPFIKIQDNYILPIPKLIWHSISTTYHYDFLNDGDYIGKYIDGKGKSTEKIVYNIFSKMYDDNDILTRVKYGKKIGEPDIDLIIIDDDFSYFIECSSKWITMDAKKGDIKSINKDIKESIIKCILQLNRAYKAYINGELINKKINKIIPIIILDDFISHLDLILKEIELPITEITPYIISIYDLDVITDLVKKEELKEFIESRINLYKKNVVYCCDEIDYFVMYKKYGLEKYANQLEKKKSILLYIGHLEELYPSYYFDNFITFCNDKDLIKMMERNNSNLIRRWT